MLKKFKKWLNSNYLIKKRTIKQMVAAQNSYAQPLDPKIILAANLPDKAVITRTLKIVDMI